MNKSLVIDALGWGIGLWLIGYVLGIILFFLLPPALIGWVISPVGLVITLWVLLARVKARAFQSFVILAVVWTLIAIVGDYLFIVRMLQPADGYYKLDVYLYYGLTFTAPLVVGWWRARQVQQRPISEHPF